MKPRIAITVGDYNGIGPEVVLKGITHPSLSNVCTPILVGPEDVFSFYAKRLGIRIRLSSVDMNGNTKEMRLRERRDGFVACVTPIGTGRVRIAPGRIAAGAGRLAALAIEKAVELACTGAVHGIVTAPVSKQALHRAGVKFPGQTEMLQYLSSSRHVAMMLVSDTMRVGLATMHIPIREVSRMLTRSLLRDRISVIHRALVTDWRIRSPRLAVLGLNPHAGEGGDIGKEDKLVIAPVIRKFRESNIHVDGPFPADSFFGRFSPDTYDAVVAMYHDQGLIPLKMSSFGKAVHVSAGLSIVRTSPDHGTAFDIAGKGIADPGSMIEAITLAVRISRNRRMMQRAGKQ